MRDLPHWGLWKTSRSQTVLGSIHLRIKIVAGSNDENDFQ